MRGEVSYLPPGVNIGFLLTQPGKPDLSASPGRCGLFYCVGACDEETHLEGK